MNVLLIYILNILSINFSLGLNAPLYKLINLSDYYDKKYSKSILCINYGTDNIILNNYNYTKNLMICNKADLSECQNYGTLKLYSENKFRTETNKIYYYVFEFQNSFVRFFTENYEYNLNLPLESSICFDFFNAHKNLKLRMNNPNKYNISLYIQYCSKSTKSISNIKLYEKTDKYLFNKDVTSLNITQIINPYSNIIFDFSPPNIHSMYCLYSSIYDEFNIYVGNITKKVPLIAPQIYVFFSIFDEKKETNVNLSTKIYMITYYFKINNAEIKDCYGYHKYGEYIHERYYCSSIDKIDNEHYKISYQIDTGNNISYLLLYLEPNNLKDDNYFGNFIEINRTFEDPEYIYELLTNLNLGVGLSILGAILLFLILYRSDLEYL